MTGTYAVDLVIGEHSWHLERVERKTDDYVITDGLNVLDGLSFGWATPTGLAPMQPEPELASLALTVPAFADVADIDIDTPVAIEVRLDVDDEDPFASFYGRVSDAKAVTRGKRPGVTLSLVAVDYTVDLADLGDWAYAGPDDISGGAARGYNQVLADIWDTNAALGALPGWPLPGGDNGPDVSIEVNTLYPVAQEVYDVLLLAVDDDATERLILAPHVYPIADGGFPQIQPFCFDLVAKQPQSGWTVPAMLVTRDTLQWRRNRRALNNTIEVTGADIRATATWPGAGKAVSARLSTIATNVDQLQHVADFYLPSPDDAGSWVFEQFTVNLTRQLDPAALATLPRDLFPQWWLDPDDPARSSCYSKRVDLDTIPADRSPYTLTGEQFIGGTLDACSITIAGGHVALTMRLRRLNVRTDKFDPPGDGGDLILGGYGLAPYGGLGIKP